MYDIGDKVRYLYGGAGTGMIVSIKRVSRFVIHTVQDTETGKMFYLAGDEIALV